MSQGVRRLGHLKESYVPVQKTFTRSNNRIGHQVPFTDANTDKISLARPWYQKTILLPLDHNPLEWKIANIVFFSSSKLLGHLRGKNLIPGRKWAERERAKTAIVQKHKMCLFWVFIFERDLHWRSVERGNVFVYVAWKIRMLWKCRAFINQVVLTQGKLDSASLPSALSALSHFLGQIFNFSSSLAAIQNSAFILPWLV